MTVGEFVEMFGYSWLATKEDAELKSEILQVFDVPDELLIVSCQSLRKQVLFFGRRAVNDAMLLKSIIERFMALYRLNARPIVFQKVIAKRS